MDLISTLRYEAQKRKEEEERKAAEAAEASAEDSAEASADGASPPGDETPARRGAGRRHLISCPELGGSFRDGEPR